MEFSGGLDEDDVPRSGGDTVPSFEELMRRATRASDAMRPAQDRWRQVAHAALMLTPELPLESVLATIVELAVDLVDAASGALERTARDESGNPYLVVAHAGVALPDPAPSAGTSDELAYPGQVANTADVLRVPVRAGTRSLGTLRLAAKPEREGFDEEDEALVSALLSIAGVALENASLREEASRRERWLLGATALLSPPIGGDVPTFVADRIRALSGADVAWVVTGPSAQELELRAVAGAPAGSTPDKADFCRSLERCVVTTGRPLRVSDLSTHPRAVDIAEVVGGPSIGTAVLVPLLAGSVKGVVAVGWHRNGDPDDVRHDDRLPALLAKQATLTLLVARDRPAAPVTLVDRDRVARDLHDLVIQRLFAMGLELKTTTWLRDPREVTTRVDQALGQLDVAIRDIRRTIFELESGAEAVDAEVAITEVVDRARRAMRPRPILRMEGPVSSLEDTSLLTDIVAVLTEALSNCARHARASSCEVDVTVNGGDITLVIADDGSGLLGTPIESGLANLRIRAERRGGTFTVASSPGHGTRLRWSAPMWGAPD